MDVIVTTTCRPHIKRTFRSFFDRVSSSEKFNFIVNVDVLDADYLPKLLKYLGSLGIDDINVNSDPGTFHHAQTRAINYLYGRISSPVYFHLQDDWLFLQKIDLDPLVRLMTEHPQIDHIRFSKSTIPERGWLYHLSERPSEEFMADHHNVEIDGINLVQTRTWSFNPSLVRTSVAKCFTDIPLGTRAETFICREYEKQFGHDGCYFYGRIGDRAAVRDIGRSRYSVVSKKVGNAVRRLLGPGVTGRSRVVDPIPSCHLSAPWIDRQERPAPSVPISNGTQVHSTGPTMRHFGALAMKVQVHRRQRSTTSRHVPS